MPRKPKIEISSRAIDVELFEPYHQHLDEYCKATQRDKQELLETFIRGLELEDDSEFPTVEQRIVNYFHTLRPNHANNRRKSTKLTERKVRSPKSPVVTTNTIEDNVDSQIPAIG